MKLNFQKISAFLFSFLIIFAVSAVLVSAQPTGGIDNPPIGGIDNPPPVPVVVNLQNPFSGSDSLFELMKNIVDNIILPIGGVLAVLAFIYSGFLYVVAQGNEAKLKTAHKSLLYTSIGTAVLLGSWVLANLICATINQLGGPICPP